MSENYKLRDILPQIVHPGWVRDPDFERGLKDAGVFARDMQLAIFRSAVGLRVIITLEHKVWLHMSCSRARSLPSWDDLKLIKKMYMGDRFAVQLFPPEKHWLNLHQFTLHLYCRVDDQPIIPEELWNLKDEEGAKS